MTRQVLTAADLYRVLIGGGQAPDEVFADEGAAFDRHVFACVLAIGFSERQRPLTEATGLSRDQLADLLHRYFPHAGYLLAGLPADPGPVADAIEEPDLRQLLLDNRTEDGPEATWLAAIVARRSLGANHLWQDLGLPGRTDLSRLLNRHFAPLASRNTNDMKWKKFFYRELCQIDGVLVCKAPNCEVCTDVGICFAEETGDPLIPLRRPVL